jgi:S-adenosylmethionine:tRNA ribosyltransferase-isomerase
LKTSEFDFELPPERIAQEPPARREDARLLVLDRSTGDVALGRFPDLLDRLRPGDALVLNETRVIPARMFATRTGTGGAVELLFVRPSSGGAWWAMAKPGKSLKPGGTLDVSGFSARLTVGACEGGLYELAYDGDWAALMQAAGHVPLPPYIRRPDGSEDRERYQTVFARVPGAIAAPTAGLHWTPSLLSEAETRGVAVVRIVLHVGPGTFRPVKVDDVRQHTVDPEAFEIPSETAASLARCRAGGGRIVAVGTTTTRTLESAADENGNVSAGAGDTDLVLLIGGPFFEDIWFAPGGHIADGVPLLQIEASAERLALNNRLDAGVVGDIAVSLRALTEALRAKASADFKQARIRARSPRGTPPGCGFPPGLHEPEPHHSRRVPAPDLERTRARGRMSASSSQEPPAHVVGLDARAASLASV